MSVNTPPQHVTRPVTTRLTSTVLDHASVVDLSESDSFGMRSDDGVWPSYNCIDTIVPVALPCADGDAGYKSFAFADWQPAYTFALMGGVQCLSVGLDRADMESELRRVFAVNEGRGVEQALVSARFVASEAGYKSMIGTDVSWDAPHVVTPAGKTVSVGVALALLESYAATVYSGVPTLHIPRGAATLLETNGLITWNGDKAYTKNGSKVAMGGGYDDQDMIQSGAWDMYATGEIYVERSSAVEITSFTTGRDGSGMGSDENQIRPNSTVTMVERMYRVVVDCFVAKVTATVF